MSNSSLTRVAPLFDDWNAFEYDLTISTLGYEARARYICEQGLANAKVKCAIAFDRDQSLEFESNRRCFERHSYAMEVVSDSEYRKHLKKLLGSLSDTASPTCRILFDISSLNRARLATAVLSFSEFGRSKPLDVDFVYALANYSPPLSNSYGWNVHVGPMIPEYAGAWDEPDRVTVGVLGLGYERDKVLGAVEFLQLADAWLFNPISVDSAYDEAVERANRTILRDVAGNRKIQYQVDQPMDCFSRLESLVRGLTQTVNIVVLPFGPKLFALSSILVADLYRSVALWRVSAEGSRAMTDRVASGRILGLSVSFAPADPAVEEVFEL